MILFTIGEIGMPDNLIRDIPLIQRYAKNNEVDDFHFRAYLKGYLNMSNEKLDGIVKETTDRVWKQIDCTTCANCCKTLEILVDNDDIQRLAARLQISKREFTEKYIKLDDYQDKVINQIPCPFLQEDNRCSVYEDRPKSCQDYPYLFASEFRSRTLSAISNSSCCPIVFNVWQILKRRLWKRRRDRR